MNFAVCDDDIDFANNLAMKIQKLEPECSVRIFNSISSLLFEIEDIGYELTAVFMDIKLNDGNGINTALKLISKFPSLKIVYVTGYGSKYSQAIFDCPQGFEPVAYLVKPVKEHYLKNAIRKLKATEKNYENITVKSGGDIVFINPKELISISCQGRKLTFNTGTEVIETNGRLSSYMEKLPECFVQTSKSHIVNISHIVKISDWKLLKLSDDSECPVTRTYCQELKQLLLINNSDLRKG